MYIFASDCEGHLRYLPPQTDLHVPTPSRNHYLCHCRLSLSPTLSVHMLVVRWVLMARGASAGHVPRLLGLGPTLACRGAPPHPKSTCRGTPPLPASQDTPGYWRHLFLKLLVFRHEIGLAVAGLRSPQHRSSWICKVQCWRWLFGNKTPISLGARWQGCGAWCRTAFVTRSS